MSLRKPAAGATRPQPSWSKKHWQGQGQLLTDSHMSSTWGGLSCLQVELKQDNNLIIPVDIPCNATLKSGKPVVTDSCTFSQMLDWNAYAQEYAKVHLRG